MPITSHGADEDKLEFREVNSPAQGHTASEAADPG